MENKQKLNCIKGLRALTYLQDVLVNFADTLSEQERDRIMRLHANCPQHSCAFPNEICDTIRNELNDMHVSKNPCFENTDCTKWLTNHWEVAKCFINDPRYKHVQSAAETDVVGLLIMFEKNKRFRGHFHCKSNMFKEVRDWRNFICHSPTMELDDQELNELMLSIYHILEDRKEITERSRQAVIKLEQLEKGTVEITMEDVMAGNREAFHQQVQELKSYIASHQSDTLPNIGIEEFASKSLLDISKLVDTRFNIDAQTNIDTLQKDTTELRKTFYKLEIQVLSSGSETPNSEFPLTENILAKISHFIGSNWQLLAFELGLSDVQVGHICEDYNTAAMRIYTMLRRWREANGNAASLESLSKAMAACKDVNINWGGFNKFKEEIQRIRKERVL